MTQNLLDYKLETIEGRKRFIKEVESGIFSGVNIDKENVIIMLEQNEGMDIKTQKKNKPQWYEVAEYDKDGICICVIYEPVE